MKQKPVVLCLSGHDPSGGAGIAADIETCQAMGVQPATVVTALTIQDTQQVKKVIPVESVLVKDQALTLLADMDIAAIKIGLLGSLNNIEVIHDILRQYSGIPVILDPVIRSGSGTSLIENTMLLAFSDLLFPLTYILTPNSREAHWLAPESDTLDACAQELMDDGCEHVLITGTHEISPDVINSWYSQHRKCQTYHWPRLAHDYHGSGCTLASALAALVARDMPLSQAMQLAQQYTWESLQAGMQLGMGQYHPQRGFWHNAYC